jgi:hypothetical protein
MPTYQGPPLTQFSNGRVTPQRLSFWGRVGQVASSIGRTIPAWAATEGAIRGMQNGGGFRGFVGGALQGAAGTIPGYSWVHDHAGNLIGARDSSTGRVVPVSDLQRPGSSDRPNPTDIVGPVYTGNVPTVTPSMAPTPRRDSAPPRRTTGHGDYYGLGANRAVDRGVMGSSNPGSDHGSSLRAFLGSMSSGSGRLGGMAANNPLKQSGLGLDKTYTQEV